MPIQSQRIVEDYRNGQNTRVLRLGFTDHTGKEHIVRRHTEEDADTYLASQVVVMAAKLGQIELREAKGRLRKGEDPRAIFRSRQHTNKAKMKAALLEAMGEMDIKEAEVKAITNTRSDLEGLS